MKLSLAAKFNLVFIFVFMVGFVAAGFVADRLLKNNAREETLRTARMLMDSALATRAYTTKQVLPLIKPLMTDTFLPQSVPSFAATEHLHALLEKYPAFSYKEATLNPTNPRDRTADWEADVVNEMRRQNTATEIVGERDSSTGRSLYMAKPLQIKDGACLLCHSVPEAAPKPMVAQYGPNNGFGWKLNEIIGAQIISVPMDVPMKRAAEIWNSFMLSLLGVFAFLFVALNVMVYFFVTRRITVLAQLADEVSMGKFDAEEFNTSGSDEVSKLAQSFGRMRTSLASAMRMLEE